MLSKKKVFRYFMHMRAKTICGFAVIAKWQGSYPTFDP